MKDRKGDRKKNPAREVFEGDDFAVRVLTPRECWRLQGLPDWAFDRARGAGISDHQLYKQAGNAVTVPVAKAFGEALAKIEREEKALAIMPKKKEKE